MVHRFEVRGRRGADVDVLLHVGSGTYVRALARDLGIALGCGAHVTVLRRTAVGPWLVGSAVPLDGLAPDTGAIHPPATAVAHLPTRHLSGEERTLVCHGRAIPVADSLTGPVALLFEGHLVAVAEPADTWLKPRVVLEG